MTRPSPARLAACLAAALLAAAPVVAAADCSGPQAAGYRVLHDAAGQPLAVWYPSGATERDAAYGRGAASARSRFAPEGAPAACGRLPLLLFSHGFGGCALQSLFITEELARQGYIVVAPDHRDAALCRIESPPPRARERAPEPSLLEPQQWNDRSYIERRDDLRAAVEAVVRDPVLGPAVDAQRIGAIGHSLGGYTALGLAGAWPSWRDPAVKAVVAMSPFVAPYLSQRALGGVSVPVMYQGAVFDWGITPMLEGPTGAYAQTPAPRYFVKLKGGTHFEWTNLVCASQNDTRACLAANGNAFLIDAYAIEFLDLYLKGRASTLLRSRGAGLDTYRFAAP